MWTLLPFIRKTGSLLFKQYLNWFIHVPWDTTVSCIDIVKVNLYLQTVMACSCWRHWRGLRCIWFTGVKNTVQWIHGRSGVDRNPRSWGDGGAWGVDECTHLKRRVRGGIRSKTKLAFIEDQTEVARSQFGPKSLKFRDIAIKKRAEYIDIKKKKRVSEILSYVGGDNKIPHSLYVCGIMWELKLPGYLVFTDCADWSCATVLALRRSRPSHCGRRGGGRAERVGGSLPSSFIHAERGLRSETRGWNHRLHLCTYLLSRLLSSVAADILKAARVLNFPQLWNL